MKGMFQGSELNGDISEWNFDSLTHPISKIGIKIEIKWKIEKIKLEKKYIKYFTCNNKFDISIKNDWIEDKNICPMCRLKWTNNTIYLIE